MKQYRSRLHFALSSTNERIRDEWKSKPGAPGGPVAAICDAILYPIEAAGFYVASFIVLRKEGKSYLYTS